MAEKSCFFCTFTRLKVLHMPPYMEKIWFPILEKLKKCDKFNNVDIKAMHKWKMGRMKSNKMFDTGNSG